MHSTHPHNLRLSAHHSPSRSPLGFCERSSPRRCIPNSSQPIYLVCSRSAKRSSSPSLTNNWLIGYNNTKNAGVSPHLISVFRFRDVLFVLVVNDYHLLTTPSTSQFFLSSFKFDYNIIVSYFTVKLFFWIKLSR